MGELWVVCVIMCRKWGYVIGREHGDEKDKNKLTSVRGYCVFESADLKEGFFCRVLRLSELPVKTRFCLHK